MSQALKRIHHVEFVVGNAKQAAYFYRKGFGFDQVAYRGPETGTPDRTSYVLKQGDIFLVLTTPLRHDDPLHAWLALHGDGVRDVAFEVTDMDETYGRAVAAGAESHAAPANEEDAQGQVHMAAIKAYGEVLHSFIRRDGYPGFLPGYEIRHIPGEGVGLDLRERRKRDRRGRDGRETRESGARGARRHGRVVRRGPTKARPVVRLGARRRK